MGCSSVLVAFRLIARGRHNGPHPLDSFAPVSRISHFPMRTTQPARDSGDLVRTRCNHSGKISPSAQFAGISGTGHSGSGRHDSRPASNGHARSSTSRMTRSPSARAAISTARLTSPRSSAVSHSSSSFQAQVKPGLISTSIR